VSYGGGALGIADASVFVLGRVGYNLSFVASEYGGGDKTFSVVFGPWGNVLPGGYGVVPEA
jgi:hypothetical protein